MSSRRPRPTDDSPGTNPFRAVMAPACAERTRLAALAGAFALVWTGCHPALEKEDSLSADQPSSSPSWFEEITAASGLSFLHETGPTGSYQVPEQMGSGAAFLDFDNDGRLDLYLVQNAGPSSRAANQLWRQSAEGHFEDVSAGSGLDVAGFGMGVAVGDVNNDGRPDVLLTEYGGIRLFLNQGGGRFADQTAAAGLDNPRWATSAAFFDYDRDGWLDLVVGNYLDYDPTLRCTDAKGAPEFCGPHGFPGLVTKLYRNVSGAEATPAAMAELPLSAAAAPRFLDVTVASGLAQVTGPALGVLCADFDGDRWPDIFLADDGRPNRLFMNRRDGTFVEEAALRGIAFNAMGQTAGNMGIAVGDADGNGWFDLFVTHLAEEYHALWTQEPRGFFQDRMGEAGLSRQGWRGTGFGAALADFDQDGDLDLAFVNGLVKRGQERVPVAAGVDPFWAPYAQRNQVFANQGSGTLDDRSAQEPAFSGDAAVGRGLACGDIDNDGAVDLLMTSTGGPARLFRNVNTARGHWLSVRVVDPSRGGRDAHGAEVIVQSGARRWWRLAQPGSSYLCSHDPRVHFGLGGVDALDSIQVLWPDGTQEMFPGGPANRFLTLARGSGRALSQGSEPDAASAAPASTSSTAKPDSP